MGLDLHAFLEDFRAEAAEHLHALDAQLLALERDPDNSAPVRAMFLAAHSLKGAGAMMDIADVEALAHAMEDVLARLRDGRQRLDATTADRLFRAIDLLRERVARAVPGAAPIDAPIVALVAALAACDGAEAAAPADAAPSDLPPDERNGEGPVALLIEESRTVRLLHAALLAEAGFGVDLARDGKEALALVGTRDYQLIVSGLEIPSLRGLDLAATLHERLGEHLPPFILMHNDDADLPDLPAPSIAAQLRTEPPGRQRLTATARDVLARAARG